MKKFLTSILLLAATSSMASPSIPKCKTKDFAGYLITFDHSQMTAWDIIALNGKHSAEWVSATYIYVRSNKSQFRVLLAQKQYKGKWLPLRYNKTVMDITKITGALSVDCEYLTFPTPRIGIRN